VTAAPLGEVSVFCADDSPRFRAVVRELIAATPGFKLVGEAFSALAALTAVPELRPDLVLIDAWMPGMSGFEAAARLAAARRDLVVVVMTAGAREAPSDFPPRGAEVRFVNKEELCSRFLLDTWHARRTPRSLPTLGTKRKLLG
jgi:chemotaxis response regulator CheB